VEANRAAVKDWLGHDDLGCITPADVQRWGDERSAAGTEAKTINDTDFAALRAVFKWGKQRGWLSTNPAAEAKIEGRGKKTTREKWFLESERAAILGAFSLITSLISGSSPALHLQGIPAPQMQPISLSQALSG
jgi:hypothetical protein